MADLYSVTCYKTKAQPVTFFNLTIDRMMSVRTSAREMGYYVEVCCPEPSILADFTDHLNTVSAAMQRIIDAYKKGK